METEKPSSPTYTEIMHAFVLINQNPKTSLHRLTRVDLWRNNGTSFAKHERREVMNLERDYWIQSKSSRVNLWMEGLQPLFLEWRQFPQYRPQKNSKTHSGGLEYRVKLVSSLHSRLLLGEKEKKVLSQYFCCINGLLEPGL